MSGKRTLLKFSQINEMSAELLFCTVSIEAAVAGWILKERGKPAQIFVRWEALVRELEERLTNKR